MGRLLCSLGDAGVARAVAARLNGGVPVPDAVTDSDVWQHLSAALARPVLLLEGDQDGALGRVFRPHCHAEEHLVLDAAVPLPSDAVLVLRRSSTEYEPVSQSQPSGRRRRVASGVGPRDIRRLARRGGVKRIGGCVPDDIRDVLRGYLREVLHDAVVVAEYNRRRTIMLGDVLRALHRRGTPMYHHTPE
jgi:histone H3/H4